MLKRTLSIILAVAMLCTLVPAYALAEEVVAEETAVVENEEVIVDEEVSEEDLELVPMASFETSNLVDEAGNPVPSGIVMPEILSAVNVASRADSSKVATTADLPQNSITYVLVDSDNANYSNFATDFKGEWINSGSGHGNVFVNALANTRRGSTSLSEHTTTFVVPESVGAEGKEFQIVLFNIRTAANSDQSRYENTGRGAHVWIDNNPVAVDITKGHDVIGNIQSHMTWVEKEMVNWIVNSDGGSGTFYIWDWGPTVTLTPGVHTIKFKPGMGTGGGRIPGFIITDAIGYDWTKVAPIANKDYTFGAQTANAAADFAGSFGAAGYIDFTAPVFDGEITVNKELTTASKIVFNVPTATDKADDLVNNTKITSAYPTSYSATANGKKAEIVDGTVTVEGLTPDTDCEIVLVAQDAVCNKAELKLTATTLGADAINYAYFAKDAAIKNATALSEADTKIAVEWPAAIPGTAEVAEPVIAYNIYANDKLVGNTAETKYTITGLEKGTEYTIKVVTCSDGVEAGEGAIGSALEAEFSTARDPEIKEVSVDATSTVLEVSSILDPSAFTFAIKSVLLNGNKADASIKDNQITVKGLVAGAANTIKVVTVETHIATGTPSDVEYPLITVTTPAAEGEFTLTADDCIAVGKGLPMPMCYDTLTADQWPTNASNTNGAGLWGTKEVYYTAQGSAKATINVSETDKFYAFTQTYSYETSRYFTATVDGTPIKNKAGDKFPFGKEGIVSPTNVEFNVCPQPVELTKGSHNIVLGSGNGIVRANFFAFIPDSYAYDENGALLDEAGEYESIVKYIKDNLSTKEAFLNFYIDPRLLTADSLTSVPLTEATVAVKWKPTTTALGKNITYNVYLDGKKVDEVSSKEIPQYVFEDLTPGQHTVKVDANGTYAQTIKIYAASVAADVAVDVSTVEEALKYADGTPVTEKVEGKDVPVVGEVDVLNDVTISVQNITEEPKNLTVVVATFGLNKMTKVKTETISLGYGKASVTIDLEGYKTKLLAQNEEVDAKFLNTKIFVIDNDGFTPYMCEY